MAASPTHIDVPTPQGVVRIQIVYTRTLTQRVPVRFCWLHWIGITHDCDEFRCADYRPSWG